MTASLPLQGFCPVLHLIAGRMFTDYRDYLRFRHSGLKSRKPFVHLTADARQTRGDYQECSIHAITFTKSRSDNAISRAQSFWPNESIYRAFGRRDEKELHRRNLIAITFACAWRTAIPTSPMLFTPTFSRDSSFTIKASAPIFLA